MATSTVVEIIDVVGHFVSELDNGGPFPTVEKFGVHSPPRTIRLWRRSSSHQPCQGSFAARSSQPAARSSQLAARSPRSPQPAVTRVAGKLAGGEIGAMVGVNNPSFTCVSGEPRHEKRRVTIAVSALRPIAQTKAFREKPTKTTQA